MLAQAANFKLNAKKQKLHHFHKVILGGAAHTSSVAGSYQLQICPMSTT